jgi:hypothetical protein
MRYIVLLVLALALAACGGTGNSTSHTTAASAAPVAAPSVLQNVECRAQGVAVGSMSIQFVFGGQGTSIHINTLTVSFVEGVSGQNTPSFTVSVNVTIPPMSAIPDGMQVTRPVPADRQQDAYDYGNECQVTGAT